MAKYFRQILTIFKQIADCCHLCTNVGCHASERDTCQVPCHLCAVATLGKATGRRVCGNGVASYAATFALM